MKLFKIFVNLLHYVIIIIEQSSTLSRMCTYYRYNLFSAFYTKLYICEKQFNFVRIGSTNATSVWCAQVAVRLTTHKYRTAYTLGTNFKSMRQKLCVCMCAQVSKVNARNKTFNRFACGDVVSEVRHGAREFLYIFKV